MYFFVLRVVYNDKDKATPYEKIKLVNDIVATINCFFFMIFLLLIYNFYIVCDFLTPVEIEDLLNFNID